MSNLKNFTEYIGYEFNKLIGNKTLYRFTYTDEVHNFLHYADGLNIDFLEFYPHGSCEKGGMYFIDETVLDEYLTPVEYKLSFGIWKWIREVEIPDDARVYVDNQKYKTDRFILKPRCSISDFRFKDSIINIINFEKYPTALYFVENQNYEMCKIAVSSNPLSIIFVKDQTIELCELAVSKNPKAISFVKKQTLVSHALAITNIHN